jgi:hypothetical protein
MVNYRCFDGTVCDFGGFGARLIGDLTHLAKYCN